MDAWLNEVNEGLLFVAVLVLLMGAAGVGFVLAQRARRQHGDTAPHASAIQGAVLGLLALLLGFTFSLAMARFETRKEIQRDEANAIGTTYLRAQLLPEPMRTQIRADLRAYVETRFELGKVSFLPERLRQAHAQASALQKRMWQQLVAAADAKADPELLTFFGESLNETIDMHATRMAAIRSRIPAAIFVVLFVVALASLGLTGYASGPNHRQSFALNALVALLIAVVMLLTFDLHRPRRGLITLDLTGLEELRESMR
jgi:hypothetical protein